jgi:hypothetical protein
MTESYCIYEKFRALQTDVTRITTCTSSSHSASILDGRRWVGRDSRRTVCSAVIPASLEQRPQQGTVEEVMRYAVDHYDGNVYKWKQCMSSDNKILYLIYYDRVIDEEWVSVVASIPSTDPTHVYEGIYSLISSQLNVHIVVAMGEHNVNILTNRTSTRAFIIGMCEDGSILQASFEELPIVYSYDKRYLTSIFIIEMKPDRTDSPSIVFEFMDMMYLIDKTQNDIPSFYHALNRLKTSGACSISYISTSPNPPSSIFIVPRAIGGGNMLMFGRNQESKWCMVARRHTYLFETSYKAGMPRPFAIEPAHARRMIRQLNASTTTTPVFIDIISFVLTGNGNTMAITDGTYAATSFPVAMICKDCIRQNGSGQEVVVIDASNRDKQKKHIMLFVMGCYRPELIASGKGRVGNPAFTSRNYVDELNPLLQSDAGTPYAFQELPGDGAYALIENQTQSLLHIYLLTGTLSIEMRYDVASLMAMLSSRRQSERIPLIYTRVIEWVKTNTLLN